MRISGLTKSSGAAGTRIGARVTWEESDRGPLDLFFETGAEFGEDLNPEANAFLLAAIFPAFRGGERRLRIEGAICPRLSEGLETVMRLQNAWHGPGRLPVAIEPAGGWRPALRGRDRAGLFLTAGVDSLHTLWWNRGNYPDDHPAAFRDAISIEAISFSEDTPSPRNLDVTRRQRRAVAAIAAETRLTTILVRSNIRALEPDNDRVAEESFSCLLACVAHAFSRRLTAVSLAAGLDLGRIIPWGTHPLLDPNYCSSSLEFRQEGWTLDRLSKIRRIAGWKAALENMMVCFEGPLPDGRFNCGRCEKCVRTMMGLLIAGKLDGATSFPTVAITPEVLDRLEMGYHLDFLPSFWAPFVEPLKARGREDLSRAVGRLVARSRRHQRWLDERDWKGRVRRFDRKHLGGVLLRASRRLRGGSAAVRSS